MSAQALPTGPAPIKRNTQPAQPAPGARFMSVQVVGRAQAARDAVTFWLAAPGTTSAPMPYLPGQFITLAFTPPAQSAQSAQSAQAVKPARTLYRSYSLCGDGDPRRPWEITVKRQHAGLVSGFLYEHVMPGMVLYASRPGGNFTLPTPLDASSRVVFVAAGSGITPLYGMLRALAHFDPAARPQVHLHYAYHSPADGIYARELAQLDPQRRWLTQWHYRSDQRQRFAPLHAIMRLQDAGIQPAQAHWYVCGPDALKRNVIAAAQRSGAPAAQLRSETFTSATDSATVETASRLRAVPAGQGRPAAIRIAESGTMLDVQPRESILDALERHGYQSDFSCRAGNCGTCMLKVLAGRVTPPAGDVNNVLSPAERAAGYVLSCTAQPIGEITLALAGTPAAVGPARPLMPVAAGTAGVPAVPGGSRVVAAARQPTARQNLQKRLRLGIAAASIALFGSVWGLTSHKVSASASTPGISLPNLLPSGSGSNSDDGGGNFSNSPAQSQSPSGPSWFSPQPGSGQPSSGTGVS